MSDAPRWPAPDCRAIRAGLGLSLAQFSALTWVPVGTIRKWESGERTPSGAAARLLDVLARRPDAVG